MLVFSISDKGGTGRTVTSCNIAYQAALQGQNVCYFDLDLGSPTASNTFGLDNSLLDSSKSLHEFLNKDSVDEPQHIDVFAESEQFKEEGPPPDAGKLIFVPGKRTGKEFDSSFKNTDRCLQYFKELQNNKKFDLCIVDVSAGRSPALELIMKVLGKDHETDKELNYVWLVFHRWTKQHLQAAHNLVYSPNGLHYLANKKQLPDTKFRNSIYYVRTAFVEEIKAQTPAQEVWITEKKQALQEIAGELGLLNRQLGEIPWDPMLYWNEQLITANDIAQELTNQSTMDAFKELAKALIAKI